MFQRFHAMREQDESGFTLIELLVVILIIAILAAIAIPVFLRQREKGWVAQSQSSLKNAATAAESYATGQNGSYLGMDLTDLQAEGFNTSPNVTIAVAPAATAGAYCITAAHSLLDPLHVWQDSTYDSDEGEPKVDDAC